MNVQHIYFAQCGDRIKIGISERVHERLAQLRTGAGGEMVLLAAVEGDHSVEKALHRKLKQHRIHGEWFRDCAEVRAAIQNSANNFRSIEAKRKKRRPNQHFAAVCKIIWPFKTDEKLALIAKTDSRTARRWLAGDSEAPACIFSAILSELTRSGGDE